jgi:hypothetical protein
MTLQISPFIGDEVMPLGTRLARDPIVTVDSEHGGERGGMSSRLLIVLLVLSGLTVSGCELAGDIFEAGMWTGIIAVVLVVGIIGFLIAKVRG